MPHRTNSRACFEPPPRAEHVARKGEARGRMLDEEGIASRVVVKVVRPLRVDREHRAHVVKSLLRDETALVRLVDGAWYPVRLTAATRQRRRQVTRQLQLRLARHVAVHDQVTRS